MARYQHLPIYKLSYSLLEKIMGVTKEFPREYKYTLGQELKSEVIGLIVLIYRANSQADKRAVLETLLERVLVIELLIRLSQDLRILTKKHYANLVEMTELLARQAEGWKKASNKV